MVRTRGHVAMSVRLAVATIVALVSVGARIVRAQSAPASTQAVGEPLPSPEPAPQPVSLDRIREGLRKERVIQTTSYVPTFRTEVEAHVIKLKNYWKDDSTAVASYVRTAIPLSHHQYLQQVFGAVGNTGRLPFEAVNNPQQFVTVPIFPMTDFGALAGAARAMKDAKQRREREQVRQQIANELKIIEAQAEKPTEAHTPEQSPQAPEATPATISPAAEKKPDAPPDR